MNDLEREFSRARRAQEIGWPALMAEEDAAYLDEIASLRMRPAPWPRFILAVVRLRRPEDCGVGDTIHRLLEPLGGCLFERWYERAMGRPCGCQDRRERLNEEFPY